MIYETAQYTVRPGAVRACKEAVRLLIDQVKSNDTGIVYYLVLQEGCEENRFLHVAAFSDREARERHRKSEAVRQFLNFVYPETIDGVNFAEERVVEHLSPGENRLPNAARHFAVRPISSV